MRRLALIVLLVLAGCGDSPAEQRPAAAPAATVPPAEPVALAPCRPPRVHRTAYPGGDERMSSIPWIRGTDGLVGLLWYWPKGWDDVDRAQVFTGGVAPAGDNAKVRRDTFAAISYAGQEGAPSYASILDLDRPGCWRLTLTTGELRAHVDIRAVAL